MRQSVMRGSKGKDMRSRVGHYREEVTIRNRTHIPACTSHARRGTHDRGLAGTAIPARPLTLVVAFRQQQVLR